METNLVSGENSSQENNLQSQNPLFQEYVDSAKAAFNRVWLNRYLWFWGIFLPLGAGVGSGFNFGNFADDEGDSGKVFEDGFNQGLEYLREYMIWIIVGVVIIVTINIVVWVLSAIARSGVIQAINELQTPTRTLTFNFKEIWKAGKSNMGRLLLFDLYIMLATLILFLILATPVILLLVNKNILGAVFVGLVALLIIFLVTLVVLYIKQVGAIMIVLSNQKPLQAIESGYSLVSRNITSSLKLFVVNMALGMIRGFVSMGVFFVVGMIGLVVAVFLGVTFGGFDEIFSNLEGNAGKIATLAIAGSIAFIIILAASLIVKAFFSLWQQDIWIWWVKRLGGVGVVEGIAVENNLTSISKAEAAPTINSDMTNELK